MIIKKQNFKILCSAEIKEISDGDFVLDIDKDGRVEIKMEVLSNADVNLNIVAGQNRKIFLEMEISGDGNLNLRTVFDLKEKSKVDFLSRVSEMNSVFIKETNNLSEEAELNFISVLGKVKNYREEIENNLSAIGASANVYGLFFTKDEEEAEIKHSVNHLSPRTFSEMFSGLLADENSKINFYGTIKMEKNAEKCVGSQKTDALILSLKAKIKAVPKLEVKNEDVRCSHGASIARFDFEKMFYLKSRGLNESEAKDLLISEHIMKVLDKIENKEIMEKVLQYARIRK